MDKNQIIAPPPRAARTKRTTSKAKPQSNVLPFRRPERAAETEPDTSYRATLLRALAREGRGEMQGLILIESTEEGELINLRGAYVDRMEHGQYVLIKALGLLSEEISKNEGAGYSTSPPIEMCGSLKEVPHV